MSSLFTFNHRHNQSRRQHLASLACWRSALIPSALGLVHLASLACSRSSAFGKAVEHYFMLAPRYARTRARPIIQQQLRVRRRRASPNSPLSSARELSAVITDRAVILVACRRYYLSPAGIATEARYRPSGDARRRHNIVIMINSTLASLGTRFARHVSYIIIM